MSKRITAVLTGAIAFGVILLTGCGSKMPKKVNQINEITYSENGEIISENHPVKKIGNEFSYNYDAAEYDFDGKMIRNKYFVYSYDFDGKLQNFAQYEPGFGSYKVNYDNSKRVTVYDLAEKGKAAIYEYDDAGRLVHYKTPKYKNLEIWLQYDFWDSAKQNVKKVIWYSTGDSDSNIGQGERWLYQWDYFYNLKTKNTGK